LARSQPITKSTFTGGPIRFPGTLNDLEHGSSSPNETYGLHKKKQMPVFRMLKREIFGESTLNDANIATLVVLTQHIYGEVERELKLTGFWESIPARNKLKSDIQKILLQPEFSALPGLVSNRAQIISRVMEIAEKNNDTILYAP
jgi:type I restriction enzyme R subunit